MKHKLFAIIGGSLLSVLVLAGCGADDQDPPPEDDVNVEDPGGVTEDDPNNESEPFGDDVEDGTENGNGNNGIGTDNGENDMNLDGDGDMMEDDNTPGEDIVEDGLDMNDDDNKDQ